MTDKNDKKTVDEPKKDETPAQNVVNTVTDEPVEQNLKIDPNDPRNQPTFTGEVKPDYLDINDPKQGNKTYAELQGK